MNLQILVRRFSIISLVFVYVVIIAGSIVRVTGSGMGCPDWPRCFGYNIPPTSIDPLLFVEGHTYHKNQMIIRNDTLWVANENLSVTQAFNREQWHKYPKHNYAIFNATQTWIEYINRLATVMFGIPVAILFVLSIIYWIRKKDVITFLLAGFTLLMLGFEAWLGKMVVDGNLKENSISYHMLGSIAIVSLLLMLVSRHRANPTIYAAPRTMKIWIFTMLFLAFAQVMLGIQVREEVDIIAKNIDDRGSWIANISGMFLLHRSFSIVVTIATIALFLQNKKLVRPIKYVNVLAGIVICEIIAGVVLGYLSMPKWMQPVHLVLGVILFGLAFYNCLLISKRKITIPTI